MFVKFESDRSVCMYECDSYYLSKEFSIASYATDGDIVFLNDPFRNANTPDTDQSMDLGVILHNEKYQEVCRYMALQWEPVLDPTDKVQFKRIYFNCDAYIMNEAGKTIDKIPAINDWFFKRSPDGEIFRTKMMYMDKPIEEAINLVDVPDGTK